jgi:hypothetical protein
MGAIIKPTRNTDNNNFTWWCNMHQDWWVEGEGEVAREEDWG